MTESGGEGLSDALRDLAENPQPQGPKDAEPADDSSVNATDEEALASEIDDESGEPIAAVIGPGHPLDSDPAPGAAAAPSLLYSPSPLRRRSQKSADNLKAVAVPVLATVGFLMLVPALWSALLFLGVPVWSHDKEGATGMGIAMLFAWPISLCLLGAAGFYFRQLRRRREGETVGRGDAQDVSAPPPPPPPPQ